MFRLFKRFKAIDWILMVVLVGFVVGSVYCELEIPTYTGMITNEMTGRNGIPTTQSILDIGWKMLGFSIGAVACNIVVGYIASFLSARFGKKLRHDIFEKVQSFSFAETSKFSTPSLITRSTNDITQVQRTMTMMLRMAVSAPITAVWAIIKIQASSLKLTLATAVAVIILIALITILFIVVMPRFKIVQKLTDKLNGVTRENLSGLKVVKAYNADQYQEDKFEKVNDDVTKNNLFVNRVLGIMGPAMNIIMSGIILTIFWLGASLMNNSELDYGTLMSFYMLSMRVLMSFMMLTMLFLLVPRATVSANRILEVLNSDNSVIDPDTEDEFTSIGEVEFQNVSFKYPDAEGYVLQDISFKANKGDIVAFIGSTGSGKSTLINLIPRFYDATDGVILVDGVDVKKVKQKTLRKKIGYIPQKGFLFSGTVHSNIALGNDGIEQGKMEDVAKVANASEFVEKMENKYEAQIAQSGKNVSGGQKQRLSIARAVAINPEIYIFDDSFSALDYKTDQLVRQNLKAYTKDATSLIVAQRIGTIKEADLIIVLDKGKAVGQGTHMQLLENCEVYREIALSQLSKEELGI